MTRVLLVHNATFQRWPREALSKQPSQQPPRSGAISLRWPLSSSQPSSSRPRLPDTRPLLSCQTVLSEARRQQKHDKHRRIVLWYHVTLLLLVCVIFKLSVISTERYQHTECPFRTFIPERCFCQEWVLQRHQMWVRPMEWLILGYAEMT